MNEKDILALEDQRFAAMCANDLKTLEGLCHDELLYTHSSGVTDTKASWLESMRSGKAKYQRGSFSDRRVRILRDVAFVNGKMEFQAELGGQQRALKLNFLNAWVNTPQGWKFVAWQSAPQPA